MFLPRLSQRLTIYLLLAVSLGGSQPKGANETRFRSDDLVEIVRLDSSIRLDVRYATPDNFMHRPMYAVARVFLQRPAAEALIRVQKSIRAFGYGLLVFDGYRPWSVTKKFWDETPPAKHKFVADPRKGSKHNRGCAVDCSLYSLSTGKEIVMPSPYDDFTEKAYPAYKGGTKRQREMRDFLRRAMEKEGFSVNEFEWWHFDYGKWKNYPVLDIPLEKLQ
jgi:D-alanyl-D-alanine dipeptidase